MQVCRVLKLASLKAQLNTDLAFHDERCPWGVVMICDHKIKISRWTGWKRKLDCKAMRQPGLDHSLAFLVFS